MPLAKQPVQVTMRGMDTRTGTKLLAPGRMTLAQNVRQRERGVYGKRWGASPYVKTASSGTIATSLGLVSAGGALTLRTADSAYTYDAVRSLWLLRGAVSRVMPSYAPATSRAYASPLSPGYKPSQISSGGYTWHFSGLQDQSVALVGQPQRSWVYRVVDSATGAEIVAETTIATAIGWQAKAVVAGGFVWLLVGAGTGGQYMYALKFNPAAPTTAPVLTTYLDTGGGAAVIQAWDVLATSNGGAVVAIMGGTASLSRLDTATGLAGTTVPMAPGWGFNAFGSLAFLKNETGTSGNYYLIAADATGGIWRVITINATTLAITAPGTSTGVAAVAGSMACGYRDQGTGTAIVFTSKPLATPATDVISRNGVVLKRGASLLGEPFQIGATWYLPVLYDDNAASLQRAYAVLDATTGAIVARTLYGLGGSAYQHASQFTPAFVDASWIAPVTVAGNVASLDVDSFDGANYSSMALSLDFGATPSPPAAVMQGQASVMPAGWPVYLSGRVAGWPGLFPHPLVATEAAQAGTGPAAGTYKLAACYVIRDNFGNLTRSAPSAIVSGIVTAANKYLSLPVPTLRMTNTAAAEVFIEPYVSGVGGTTLFRQAPRPNDPTIDSVTFQLGLSTAPLLTGTEVLYTQSGELANDPPPPCLLVAAWRNRVLVSGTDAAGEVWPSKEIQPGKGIEFSGGLMFMIPGDTGAIRAMGPVDHNYFAFFKQDGTWAVSGTGPDSQGRGNYEPVRLAGDRGCTNPASLCSSKAGLYFQALDGGIYLLDSALQVSEQVVDGMYGYRAQAVTGAVDLPSQRQVRFYLADGTALVLDWGNASAENPVGEWYIDTGVNGVGGATVHNDVPHHAAADGTVAREISGQWFDGTATAILRKMRLPLTLSGVRGYQRLYRGQVVGQYRGQHSLKVTFDAYSGSTGETGGTSQNWVKVVSAGPELVEFRPTTGKVTIFDVTVEDTGADLTEGGTLDGIGLEIGIKPGLPRVGSAQRF
jgi:hypothetical protein